jgi:hypothetical protein
MMIADLRLKRMRKLVMQEQVGVGWALVVDFPPLSTFDVLFSMRRRIVSACEKYKYSQHLLLQAQCSQEQAEIGPVDSKSRAAEKGQCWLPRDDLVDKT